MVWLCAFLLQDALTIPQNFEGWQKEGSWKWKGQVLSATALSTSKATCTSTLLRASPARYTMEAEFKVKPDPAQNVLFFIHFKGHDAALNIDFEKNKPRISLGMACTYTPEGTVAFYESVASPIDDINFKEWVRCKIVVDSDKVRVHLNERKLLSSDLSDLMRQQDTAGKEPYGKRIHQGVGVGLWNQSIGGSSISVEFRGFKITP